MLTYRDVLTKTEGDLKEWNRLIENNSDLAQIFPEHTEELEMTISALEKAEEADAMNEWISVKEQLPDPGDSVIVTAVLGSGQRVVRAATYTTFGFSGNGNFTDVRAWIKMPEPYEEED